MITVTQDVKGNIKDEGGNERLRVDGRMVA